MLLVGLKSDFRVCHEFPDTEADRDTSLVTSKRIRAVARAMQCSFIECSAKSGWNVEEVFDVAVEIADMAKEARNGSFRTRLAGQLDRATKLSCSIL